jgi:hypothetical protein
MNYRATKEVPEMPKGIRRLRPFTPEYNRRLKIRRELEDLGIRAVTLHKSFNIDASLITRWFQDEIDESKVEPVVMRALEEARKKAKARKHSPILYV